ncbi:MAG: hypothetical protein RL264_806 [Bacteroidota bacterium]
MRKIVWGVLLAVAVSCQASSSNSAKSEKEVKEMGKPVANGVAVFEVEGMVCEMGCGGSIRKDLLETNAVARVEVDYLEEREKQTIKVHYDSKRISPNEIEKVMEKTNDKQFTVYHIGNVASSVSSKKGEEGTVKMKQSSYELPNLIDIISSLIVQ